MQSCSILPFWGFWSILNFVAPGSRAELKINTVTIKIASHFSCILLVRVHSSIKEIESLSMTEIFTSQILGKKDQQQKVVNLTFFSGFLSCQKSSQPDIGQITSRITNIHLDIQPFSAPITKYALGKIFFPLCNKYYPYWLIDVQLEFYVSPPPPPSNQLFS